MLTAKQVDMAKSDGRRIRKLRDDKGLYLWVYDDGRKYWRLRYYWRTKEKNLALGVYPQVSLKAARAQRDEARKLIAADIDPAHARKLEKLAKGAATANTFKVIAEEWVAKGKREGKAPATINKLEWLLRLVYPLLGDRPISEIEPPELLAALRTIERRGRYETAKRMRSTCGAVFRYAIATARASRDPSADLKDALTSHKAKHHASITEPDAIGALLRAIDGYDGQPETRLGLKLLALTFVRPGELRFSEWSEFDVAAKEWRIPSERMKMRSPHRVPLSTQALVVLEELHPLTGRSCYLFPSVRSLTRPMSENTLNAALRRLGYTTDDMTAHGFRSMASTRLNEMRLKRNGQTTHWPSEAIERQLAHQERNKIRAAYTSDLEYWDDRVEIMQAWADHLDALRANSKVVSFRPVV